MENLSKTEIDYLLAKERVIQLKKFYTNLALFAVALVFFVCYKQYQSDDFEFLKFNNYSIIFFIWAIILAIKSIKIFFLNQDWERKIIDKELKKNQNGKH